MSAYVDLSSSEESENKVAVAKRRRNDDSESGSDVSTPTEHHTHLYCLPNSHITLSICSTIRQAIQTRMRDAVAVAMLEQELAVSYPPVAVEDGHLERVVEEIQTLRMKRSQRYPMQIVM